MHINLTLLFFADIKLGEERTQERVCLIAVGVSVGDRWLTRLLALLLRALLLVFWSG